MCVVTGRELGVGFSDVGCWVELQLSETLRKNSTPTTSKRRNDATTIHRIVAYTSESRERVNTVLCSRINAFVTITVYAWFSFFFARALDLAWPPEFHSHSPPPNLPTSSTPPIQTRLLTTLFFTHQNLLPNLFSCSEIPTFLPSQIQNCKEALTTWH